MAAARLGRDFFLDADRRRAYGKKNFSQREQHEWRYGW
jgi:hypothetical protein